MASSTISGRKPKEEASLMPSLTKETFTASQNSRISNPNIASLQQLMFNSMQSNIKTTIVDPGIYPGSGIIGSGSSKNESDDKLKLHL